jgi:hypothetical protein
MFYYAEIIQHKICKNAEADISKLGSLTSKKESFGKCEGALHLNYG